MSNAPQWWYVVSGLFFGLGLVFYVVLIGLLLSLISMVKKLNSQVSQLMKKIDTITVKVDGLVGEVRSVTQKVGVQATGAASNLNALTAGFAQKAEIASVVLVALGALRQLLASRQSTKPRRR